MQIERQTHHPTLWDSGHMWMGGMRAGEVLFLPQGYIFSCGMGDVLVQQVLSAVATLAPNYYKLSAKRL